MCLLNPSETSLILLNPPFLLPPILVRQKMGLTWDLLGTHLGLNADGIVSAIWRSELRYKGTAFSAHGNSCPGIENGISGPLLQRIRFPFANRRRETQKNTSVKNTKFCKYEVETIAGTRRLQNQLPHTCFFIGPLRGKISSPFAAYVSIFSP